MKKQDRLFTIGETAERCDIATSTLRFYEKRGLIHSTRTSGNQRRYHPSVLRKVSVIKAAQTLGLTLEEIENAFATLPDSRTPTKKDWERMASKWKDQLDNQIIQLQRLRNNLSGCIGCGCLSLKICSLFNADDHIAHQGNGPRYLIDGYPDTEKD